MTKQAKTALHTLKLVNKGQAFELHIMWRGTQPVRRTRPVLSGLDPNTLEDEIQAIRLIDRMRELSERGELPNAEAVRHQLKMMLSKPRATQAPTNPLQIQTVGDACRYFAANFQAKSKATMRGCRSTLEAFCETESQYGVPHGELPVEQLLANDVVRFISQRGHRDWADKTCANFRSYINRVLATCEEVGALRSAPTIPAPKVMIDKQESSARQPKALSPAQRDELLAIMDDLGDSLKADTFRFALFTGMRTGEVRNIRAGGVVVNENGAARGTFRADKNKGAGETDRTNSIPPQALEAFQRHSAGLDPSERVFGPQGSPEVAQLPESAIRSHENALQDFWCLALFEAGWIKTPNRRIAAKDPGYLRPYNTRHTFATEAAFRPNMPLKAVSKQLGHSTTAITERTYIQDNDQALAYFD